MDRSSRSKHTKRPTGDDFIIEPGMVKHPPGGAWSPEEMQKLPLPYVCAGGGTLDWLISFELKYREDQFKETGDPLRLLEAFSLAHNEKLYPPLWVLEALAKTFRQYEKSQGRETLDDLLGLRRGQRADSWFLKRVRDDLHFTLGLQMFWLKCLFGKTTKEAARMVQSKRKAYLKKQTSPSMADKISFSAKTLAQHYSRYWKKQFKFDEDDIDAPQHPLGLHRNLSDQDREQFISSFPR